MNKKDWYKSLSLADDKFIAEAHPDNKGKPKTLKIVASAIAACACLALVFCSLWLFIPFSTTPTEMPEYADSEYYDIIEKLNVLTFEQPKYKNNAEKLLADLELRGQDKTGEFWGAEDDLDAEDSYEDDAAPEDGLGSNYEEITDNQVEGIIEADRIKRSDKYIYYLDKNTLRVFSIDKEKTKEIGSYALYSEKNKWYFNQWEFYLSNDCKTVTVITQFYNESKENFETYVKLISLDVSDPTDIVKKDEFNITGNYKSSRVVDGSILLMTEFFVNKKDINFDDETTFIPQIDEGNGSCSISSSSIVSPDTINDTNYTVIVKLDENTLDLKGTAAYLSYSQELYVSENHIFLTRKIDDEKENNDDTVKSTTMTEISALSYDGDSLERKGSVTVKGYIKDQWSMDEYEGILRVVATTSTSTRKRIPVQNDAELYGDFVISSVSSTTNASLYCVDLSSFKVVASVEEFAPPNEVVQSVRFDKNTAYVCTSIQLSDPVFFFDLSNLKNITYKETGTIEGFSSSLINLGNGYLCGIGRGNSWDDFKVEVYKEAEDGVKSVCSYELENASYSTEYKSYYIDRKNQLIGLGIYDYNNYQSTRKTRYILLHFNDKKLKELINVQLSGNIETMRGVYIDGYMYMFGESDFKVEKVFD